MSSENSSYKKHRSASREKLYEIIFEADTVSGKIFDVVLLIAILASVITVMLETVPTLQEFQQLFFILEWIFTIFFTIEYIIRLYTAHRPMKYAVSFYGIVDLLSILPTYIAIFLTGVQSLMIIRALRLLRVFRIFKLGTFLTDGQIIVRSLKESRGKIIVFLSFILIMVCIFGSVMYLVEGAAGNEAFDSIPRGVYWAIVTLTTVGFGDISPTSSAGQFIAAIIMIMGYSVIAVPTGIVTTEFSRAYRERKLSKGISTQVCGDCMHDDHDKDARFCKICGYELHPEREA
jgi:voltage-gated potassium channel